MNPYPEPQTRASDRSAGVARLVGPTLGLAFIFVGGAKLRATERFVQRFSDWGLDAAVIPWTGAVEIVLGLGLFFHATRTFAAAALAAWMLGAAIIHLGVGELALSGLPLTVLAIAVAVAVSGVRAGWHRRVFVPAPLLDPPGAIPRRIGFLLQLVGVSFLVRWAIGGKLFWAALPVLGLMHSHREHDASVRNRVERVLLYLLVLGAGVSGLWGFVGHFLLSDQIALSIGWAPGSPFQHELAFYHLAMGVVALMCIWIRDRYWIAAGLIPALFALGAGVVHVRDVLDRGNTAPANWGADVLVGNLVIPVVLLALLAWHGRLGGWETPRPAAGGRSSSSGSPNASGSDSRKARTTRSRT